MAVPNPLTLWAASLFGYQTKHGRVELSASEPDGKVIWQQQVSIEEARNFAMHILEAAEAAETDEIVYWWLKDEVKMESEQNLLRTLVVFRSIREKRLRDRQQ